MTGPNRPGRWRIDMTEQEQLRQLKEEYENMIIPEAGRERLQAGIDRARMEKKRVEHARRRSAWTAVAAAAVVMIALPNTNIQIAHAMENIPLLGGFFRLVTVRQYNYSDENHDAEVELAQINYGEDAGEGASVGEVAATPKGTAAGSVEGVGQEAAVANLSEDGVEAVNQDMEATVEELIRQFEDTLSEEGYHGLHVVYISVYGGDAAPFCCYRYGLCCTGVSAVLRRGQRKRAGYGRAELRGECLLCGVSGEGKG